MIRLIIFPKQLFLFLFTIKWNEKSFSSFQFFLQFFFTILFSFEIFLKSLDLMKFKKCFPTNKKTSLRDDFYNWIFSFSILISLNWIWIWIFCPKKENIIQFFFLLLFILSNVKLFMILCLSIFHKFTFYNNIWSYLFFWYPIFSWVESFHSIQKFLLFFSFHFF